MVRMVKIEMQMALKRGAEEEQIDTAISSQSHLRLMNIERIRGLRPC